MMEFCVCGCIPAVITVCIRGERPGCGSEGGLTGDALAEKSKSKRKNKTCVVRDVTGVVFRVVPIRKLTRAKIILGNVNVHIVVVKQKVFTRFWIEINSLSFPLCRWPSVQIRQRPHLKHQVRSIPEYKSTHPSIIT